MCVFGPVFFNLETPLDDMVIYHETLYRHSQFTDKTQIKHTAVTIHELWTLITLGWSFYFFFWCHHRVKISVYPNSLIYTQMLTSAIPITLIFKYQQLKMLKM